MTDARVDRWASWLSGLLGVGVCAFIFATQYASIPRPLNWDEIDYVQAARRGVVANYLERGSLSALDVLALARAKTSKTATTLESLARLPPEDESPSTLRHNHPPLLIYALAPWTDGTPNEETRIRSVYIVLTLFLAAAAWLRWGNGVGALGLVLLLTSSTAAGAFEMINFHLALAVALVLFLISLESAVRRDQHEPAVSVGLAFCCALLLLTLETGIVILGIVSAAVLLFMPWRSKAGVKPVALAGLRYLGCCGAFLWLLWPGSLKTGAPFTTYVKYAYQMWMVPNDDLSRISFAESWKQIVAANPLLFAFCAVGVASLVFRFSRSSLFARVSIFTGVAYCIFIGPVLAETRYAFPGFVLLTVGAIDTLRSNVWPDSRRILSIAFAALLLAFAVVRFPWEQTRRQAFEERRGFERVLATLRSVDRSSGPLLVDGGHIFKYYDPTLNIERLTMVPSSQGGGLFVRRHYEYVNVDEPVSRHAYSAIVRQYGVGGLGTRLPLSLATQAIVDREYPRQEVIDRYWVARSR